jgi:hypothetical protein
MDTNNNREFMKMISTITKPICFKFCVAQSFDQRFLGIGIYCSMSRKKGLSADEKRIKLRELLLETV